MSGSIKPIGGEGDIDAFKAECLAFCNAQPGRSQHLAFAKTKIEELIYCLRRHRETVGVTSGEGDT